MSSPDTQDVLTAIHKNIQGYLHDDAHSYLFNLSNDDAQLAIDEVWKLLSSSDSAVTDDKLTNGPQVSRGRIRRLLLKLALKYSKLPTLLVLKGVRCTDTESRGSGGFADVFSGSFKGASVALKRLRAFAIATEEQKAKMREAFFREALLWMNLSHPNILQFIGVSDDVFRHRTICMVLPWMPNGNIRHYKEILQREGKLNGLHFTEHVDRWLHEVASGLAYLHHEGIVHGDLHGGNILVDADGTTRLTDFGMALIADATSYNYASIHGGGATRWQAPELIDPEEYGFTSSRSTYACDVYSFAFVCIELYTGQLPFAEFADLQIVLRVLRGLRPTRPILPDGTNMPDAIWELTGSCWAAQPSERPLSYQVAQTLGTISTSSAALAAASQPAEYRQSIQRNAQASAAFVISDVSSSKVQDSDAVSTRSLPVTASEREREFNEPAEEHLFEYGVVDESERRKMTLPDQVLSADVREIARGLINEEDKYVQLLDELESNHLVLLKNTSPSLMSQSDIDEFVRLVFRNILDIRNFSRTLVAKLRNAVENSDSIQSRASNITAVLSNSMGALREVYLTYAGTLDAAQTVYEQRYVANPVIKSFNVLLEQKRKSSNERPWTLKDYIELPVTHLRHYAVYLDALGRALSRQSTELIQETVSAFVRLHMLFELRRYQAAAAIGHEVRRVSEWVTLVPQDIREVTSKNEIRRQSILFELINGEIDMVADMEFTYNTFAPTLLGEKSPLAPEIKHQFVQDVFSTLPEMTALHRPMLRDLQALQSEQWPFVRSVTSIFLDMITKARSAYSTYIVHSVISSYLVDREMTTNPAFAKFLQECVRLPQARRLDLKAFLSRPVLRLLRYSLLFSSILRETPGRHEDQILIPKAIEVLKEISAACEGPVAEAQQMVKEWSSKPLILPETGKLAFTELEDEARTLLAREKVQLPQDISAKNPQERCAFVFDHLLLLAVRDTLYTDQQVYKVYRRVGPIPLELIKNVTILDLSERVTNFHIPRPSQLRLRFSREDKKQTRAPADADADADSEEETVKEPAKYACSINYHGSDGPFKLLFWTELARAEWVAALQRAIVAKRKSAEENAVFRMVTIHVPTSSPLSPSSSTSSSIRKQMWRSSETVARETPSRITCSLQSELDDGRKVLAVGTGAGLYTEELAAVLQTIAIKPVSQCAVLQKLDLFLLLADGVMYSGSAATLNETRSELGSESQVSGQLQNLGIGKYTTFFRIGKIKAPDSMDDIDPALICVTTKASKSTFSVFKVQTKGLKSLPNNWGDGSSSWCTLIKEFSLPAMAYDLVFVHNKPVILADKGFMLMDSVDSMPVVIPVFASLGPGHDPLAVDVAKRCKGARPIGLLNSREDEFLLCYEDFGFYIDLHGRLSRKAATLEWHSKVDSVAMHAPYFFLFNKEFIEIRHLDSGRPVQYISGTGIRCTWDGRANRQTFPLLPPGRHVWGDEMSSETQVHVLLGNVEMTTEADSTSSVYSDQSVQTYSQLLCGLVPAK